ncbi:MAG: type II toxin-antitoxin system VapC family toxin [Actinobacteria bacterium]|nr:type II toxin-antitoxin system VapC family toxin [Actinomycetota bacterium]
MTDVLVDTDVFIDHLRGARALRTGVGAVSYSVVTRCELFAGRATDEDAVALLLGAFREIPVERSIAEWAGRIRREFEVRTPDALIAASALQHGLILMTRNRRDFAGIPGLEIVAPHRVRGSG